MLSIGMDPGQRPPQDRFRHDADRYLSAVRAMPTYADRERDVEQWTRVFGSRYRDTITALEIRATLHGWRASGLAAATCNHRRTALMHLWNLLDGKSQPNPVRDVPRFPEPPALPRARPMAEIRLILRALRRDKISRTRLTILAATALRPAELMRLTPERRRKGWLEVPTAKGGIARTIPLTRWAEAAFDRLDRQEGWGHYSESSLWQRFTEGCDRVGVPRFKPYDLRHSHATAVLQAGADLADVQYLLGHSDIALTRRYAAPQSAKLSAALRRAFG
jgi:integrase